MHSSKKLMGGRPIILCECTLRLGFFKLAFWKSHSGEQWSQGATEVHTRGFLSNNRMQFVKLLHARKKSLCHPSKRVQGRLQLTQELRHSAAATVFQWGQSLKLYNQCVPRPNTATASTENCPASVRPVVSEAVAEDFFAEF